MFTMIGMLLPEIAAEIGVTQPVVLKWIEPGKVEVDTGEKALDAEASDAIELLADTGFGPIVSITPYIAYTDYLDAAWSAAAWLRREVFESITSITGDYKPTQADLDIPEGAIP